jgi:hypothetical protein
MHRSNHTHCFWHATDPTLPALSKFHRAELNLPTDPIPAEENTAVRNYLTGQRYARGIQINPARQPAPVGGPTTLSAYEHGQNAARRGKHVQACPFDAGTVEWFPRCIRSHDLSDRRLGQTLRNCPVLRNLTFHDR